MHTIKKIILTTMFSIMNCQAQESFESLFNQGTQEFQCGNHDQAIVAYKKALSYNTTCPQLYFNLGLVHLQQKCFEQAADAFKQAIDHDANYTKARYHLGTALRDQEKNQEALEQFQKTLSLDPNHYDALVGLARVLNAVSKFEESTRCFERALGLQPQNANILLEYANTLNMANQTEKALEIYYKILAILPNNSSIMYNVAYTLKKLNRIEEALPVYQRVLELDPNNSEAHFSLSLAYLITGNFEQGWPEYEWRWKRDQGSARNLSKPLWDGTPLHGKTILLHAEQGLGDSFQFIRYAKMVKERGGKIVAAVHSPLVTLFKLCPYMDTVISLNDNLPFYDVHAPLMSLPYLLKTRAETIPHDMPYLYADPALVESWKEKLSADKKFKIGICWQGNSNYSTHFLRTAVAAKSISLPTFMPLLTMPGVSTYNLQKVTGEDQLNLLPTNASLINFGDDFDTTHGRFMDTAAVMKNLDLIITVDTSIAHLAGGLGVPAWVFLPEPPDWRWMLKRTDTPWYPTMRLFRQPAAGDWDSVMQTITAELTKLMTPKQSIAEKIRDIQEEIARIEQQLNLHEHKQSFDANFTQLNQTMFALCAEHNKLKKAIQGTV
ncbi:MAG: tetratricopeptide repeat protein [Candidatus Dependentiae bacterium]|nr:tetratricopeptide repeat protein [Candidatus Dependentiae bacterium]